MLCHRYAARRRTPAPGRAHRLALALGHRARGRIARYDLGTGRSERLGSTAWDVTTGPGVVAWRNEAGAWLQRDGRAALVADSGPVGEYEGPPSVLFAPDGRSALLSWQAEWALHHELLAADAVLRIGAAGAEQLLRITAH